MNQVKDVQPIRNQQQLEDMQWALKRHCSERDYILFIVGCETGLRVGDLLKLKPQQILAMKRKQDKILRVKEGKMQKNRTFISRFASKGQIIPTCPLLCK